MKSWSPPRPAAPAATVADLHNAIQRIEERRSSLALSTPSRPVVNGGPAHSDGSKEGGASSLLMTTPSGFSSGAVPPHHRATLQQHSQPQQQLQTVSRASLLTSPHASPAVTATTSAQPGVAVTTTASTTEAALLRLDLEHKRGELDLKRKAIVKLEEDQLRLLNEISELRRSESEKRDAAAAAHRQELARERNAVAELQSQIAVEVARRGAAEREVAALTDSKARVQELEQQLRTTRELLRDREQELAAAQGARHAADDRLNEVVAGDQTHILRGRVKELEARWEHTNSQLDGLQHALSDEHRRRGDVEQTLAERDRDLSTAREQLATCQVQVTELQELLRSKDHEIARLAERLDGVQSHFREAEHEQMKKLLLAQQEADECRAESRKRTQQMYQLESSLIEAFEKQKRAEDEREAMTKAIEVQRAEMATIAQRLRASHEAIEERESELAKQFVLRQELKSQLVVQKSATETLQGELASAATTERQLRDALAEFADIRTEKAAAEELCAVLRRALLERDAEMSAEHEATTLLRERLGAAEQQIVACQQALSAKQDVERRAGMREEELAVLRADLKVSELREAALKEDLVALRQSLLVAETRAAVERDRREELEKKLRILESAAQDSFGTYGKYVALQQYLTSATSEGAKAAELNHALLDEVKMLETRCRDQERTIAEQQQLIDELRKFSDLAESLERDLSRTLTRAREAEEREAELRRRMRDESSQNRQRMNDLEVLLLETSRRSAAGSSPPRHGDASSPESDSGVLASSPSGVGVGRVRQLPPPGHRQRTAASLAADVRPSASYQEKELRHSQTAYDRDAAVQDEEQVSSASDDDNDAAVRRREEGDGEAEDRRGRFAASPLRASRDDRRVAGAPPPLETLPSSDAVLRELTQAKEEKGKLEVQLSVLQEKFVQQDTRMEQLSQQFVAALGEIKRLKSSTGITASAMPSATRPHPASPPLDPASEHDNNAVVTAPAIEAETLAEVGTSRTKSSSNVTERVRSPPPTSPNASQARSGATVTRRAAPNAVGGARGGKDVGKTKNLALSPLEIARLQRDAEHRGGSALTPSPVRRAVARSSVEPPDAEQRPLRAATAGRSAQHDSARDRMEQLFRHAQQYAFASPSPKSLRGRNDSASPQRELTAVLSPSR